MRIRLTTLLSAASLALSVGAMNAVAASAQGTPNTVCKDGTTTQVTGKGACSSHGGVDTKVTANLAKANKGAAKADDKAIKADAKAGKGDAKADAKAVKADAKADKADAKVDQKVAKAEEKAVMKQVKCTDGTMSKGGRGACSGHGGIAKAGK